MHKGMMMGGGHGPSKCKAGMLLVLGVLFLLGTTGVWPEFSFMKYWPLFLVLWGAHDLFCVCCGKSKGMKEEGGCGCGGSGECCSK